MAHEERGTITSQLRMCGTREGELGGFSAERRAGVMPLLQPFSFKVEGAWAIRDANEFVWILSHEGLEGFEAREAEYYASRERKALRPDPARHLEHTDTRLMTAVLL